MYVDWLAHVGGLMLVPAGSCLCNSMIGKYVWIAASMCVFRS